MSKTIYPPDPRNKNSIVTLPPEELKDEEDITAKIPSSSFAHIYDVGVEVPFTVAHIVFFQAKPEYEQYYTTTLYAVHLKSETASSWLGVPIKNPSMGLMKWDKKVWNKVYGFTLNISMVQDI